MSGKLGDAVVDTQPNKPKLKAVHLLTGVSIGLSSQFIMKCCDLRSQSLAQYLVRWLTRSSDWRCSDRWMWARMPSSTSHSLSSTCGETKESMGSSKEMASILWGLPPSVPSNSSSMSFSRRNSSRVRTLATGPSCAVVVSLEWRPAHWHIKWQVGISRLF